MMTCLWYDSLSHNFSDPDEMTMRRKQGAKSRESLFTIFISIKLCRSPFNLTNFQHFFLIDKINALVVNFFKNQTRLKCCPFTFSHTIWHFELQHGGAEKAKMLCVLLCLRWSELLFGKPVPILAWQLLDAVALTHARSHSLDFSTLLHDDVKAV